MATDEPDDPVGDFSRSSAFSNLRLELAIQDAVCATQPQNVRINVGSIQGLRNRGIDVVNSRGWVQSDESGERCDGVGRLSFVRQAGLKDVLPSNRSIRVRKNMIVAQDVNLAGSILDQATESASRDTEVADADPAWRWPASNPMGQRGCGRTNGKWPDHKRLNPLACATTEACYCGWCGEVGLTQQYMKARRSIGCYSCPNSDDVGDDFTDCGIRDGGPSSKTGTKGLLRIKKATDTEPPRFYDVHAGLRLQGSKSRRDDKLVRHD